MVDFLTTYAEQLPNKVAVIEDRPGGAVTEWTFERLEQESNRLAHVLQGLGVGPGTKVVWCGPNSVGIVRAVHALRKVGAVAVPLNYRLTEAEAAFVVDNCDAEVAYVDAEMAPLFARIADQIPKVREVLVFDGAPLAGQKSYESLAATAPLAPLGDELSAMGETMTYTSGTTGKPKGAVRYTNADTSTVVALVSKLEASPSDVYICTGPMYHSGPGGFLILAHALSNTAIVQRKFDAEDWLRLVDRYKASTTFTAPTPIRMVTALPAEVKARYSTASMRVLVANAAPWTMALKEAYLEDFPPSSLYEVYGSTELGVNCLLLPEDQLRKRGSCGQAAPLVEIKLFDDDGREVTGIGPEHTGELYVRNPNSFAGYYNHEGDPNDVRGEYRTVGDIAYRDDEGFYYICDRKKDMIISGGTNVYSVEVESVIDDHPAVYEVAVFGIPSADWGEAVHAVVVPKPGASLSEAEVIAFAREHLAGFKVPRSVSFAEDLPKTGSGKVLKRQLRAPYWEGYSRAVG